MGERAVAGVLMRSSEPRRLVVGVTGHRLNLLPAEHLGDLARALATAFERIDATRRASGARRRPALLTSVAEGTDRLAARAAMARGWPMRAVIPYAFDRYSQDFTSADSVREFGAMIAACGSVRVLDGAAIDGARGEYMGYAAAGEILAATSDVVVAVWNGAPPNGPGGTAEVAAIALDLGKPVIWIDPDGANPRLVLPDAQPQPRSFRARLLAGLAAAYPRIARPADMRRAD